MLKFSSHLVLFLAIACAAPEKSQTSRLDWKEESRKLAHEYAESIGELYPEYVSKMGFTEFEGYTTPFSKDLDQERYVLAYKWKSKLERRLESETHEELRTDIKILLDKVTMDMEGIEVSRKEGIVPFLPVYEYVYLSLKDLLKKDLPPQKHENAMKRLRAHVHGDEGQLPLVNGFTAYALRSMKHLEENRKRGFWPTKTEIETYFRDSQGYLKAIEELLADIPQDVWKSDVENMKFQEKDYQEFVKKKILPYARTNNTTPYNIYAYILKDMGVKKDPNDLIETAKNDYRSTYTKFSFLAQEVAEKYNLSQNDPLAVINFLRNKRIEDTVELLKLYQKTNEDLFQIVKKNDLITMQTRPNVTIRFATKAESQSLPAPHFNNAPLFGEDQNKPSEFVITPTDNVRDDFSYPEAVITLTAHETMPGHALQYHAMRERGTTLMRSWLAFNSVNVEGWGLYAEDIVYPYLSKEAQFVTLQRRLWRQARMFLDPELNLGMIKPQRVLDLYTKELGFSLPFAESELRRYSYIMPGQATAYYYGYKKLMGMKSPKTNHKCFNDTVLNLGILPLDEISGRLKKANCEAP